MNDVPEFEFVFHSNEVERSLKVMASTIKNLKPALQKFGVYLMEKLKKRMASRGDGTWPDYAASTKARKEAMGTGKITKFGKVRAAYLKKLVSYENFLQGTAKREEAEKGAVSEQTLDKLVGLDKKVQKLREQKEKVRNKAFKQRTRRKGMQSKEDMLGKLKRLKVRIKDGVLRIGLLDGPDWAWRHNEGDGPLPERRLVPEQLDTEDLQKFIEIMEEHLIYMFENSSSQNTSQVEE